MALSSATKENIALKKLVGKAHTTNSLEAFAEPKTTGLSQSTSTIFADAVPATPSSTTLYERDANNIVEYVKLVATSLSEGEKNGKRFAFKLSLPSDYLTNPASDNPKKGTGVFVANKDLHNTAGKLQLVPPSFGDLYEAKPYYGGDATTKNSGTSIPLLDDRSWYLDYFNGILYQDVPPGDGDHAKNPDFIEAFIYIGTMADTAISSSDISSSSIDELTDVDITTVPPTNNQVLKWDGTKFIPSSNGTSFTADTSSMWDEGDVQNPNDPVENQIKELYPHGIIDGTLDTGMFAINLSAASINYADPNVTLHDVLEELSSMNAYTPSTKSSGNISDAYFEIYTDPNDDGGAECIRPKE